MYGNVINMILYVLVRMVIVIFAGDFFIRIEYYYY